MFKFIEYRNLEQFENFLNKTPKAHYHQRVKKPRQPYTISQVQIQPLKHYKSEQLPYKVQCSQLYYFDERIYLVTQFDIMVFDVAVNTELIKRLSYCGVHSIVCGDDCLVICQSGQVNLLEIGRDYENIGIHKFETPYVLSKSLMISYSALNFYDIIVGDDNGNLIKLYCNVYKIFKKRQITFTKIIILERGEAVQQQNQQQKPWWVEKSKDYKIVMNDKRELLSLVLMQEKIVLVQLRQQMQIYRVTQDKVQLIHRIVNENVEEQGLTCIGRGCIDLPQAMICCNYGKQLHLFSFVINENIICVSQIGSKKLGDQKLLGMDFMDTNLILIHSEEGLGIIHIEEFINGIDSIEYIEQFKLQKFNFTKQIGLSEDCFEYFRLEDVDSYITELINKAEFKKAMQVAIRVLNGDVKLLRMPLSMGDIKTDIFEKLAFTQCIFELKSPNFREESLYEIVKFLIYTNHYDYLFTVIREVLEQHDQPFLKIIKHLISLHQIAYIPDEQLYDLCQLKEEELIHNLVNSLDLKQVQIAILIKACDQLQMDDDMIYVCQARDDFLTPLVKFLGRNEVNGKCYEYVVQLIDGRMNTGDDISEQLYGEALKNLIQFLFVKENLQRFLDFNIDSGLNIIFKLFKKKAMYAIQSRKIDILIKIGDSQVDLDQFSDLSLEYSIHRKMYLILQSVVPQNKFIIFSAKLIINGFPLSQETGFKLLFQLFKEPMRQEMDNFNQIRNQFYMKILSTIQLNQEQYNQLIQNIDDELKRSNYFIFNFILIDTLCEVFIYSKKGQYQEAFKSFCQIEDKSIKEFIFLWLQALIQIRPMLQNAQNDEDFLCESCLKLIEIDEEKAHNFIEKYLHGKHYLILEYLNNINQNMFINYMRFLFSNSSKLYMLNDRTKILYLEHLCKTKPKEVHTILKSTLFPLDEALQLTLTYKIQEATAYIYKMTGAISQALEIYTSLFLKKLKKRIAIMLKQNIIMDLSKLQIRLDQVIEFIISEEYDNLDLWFQFLDAFFKENKIRNFTRPQIPQLIKSTLSQFLSYFLLKMSEQVNVTELFELLNKKYSELPIYIFRQTINSIKKQVTDDTQKLIQAQDILESEKRKFIFKMNQLYHSAWVADTECNRCHQPLLDAYNSYIFTCKHAYHDYCVLKAYAKVPYCDHCNDDISYKSKHNKLKQIFIVLVEPCLKTFDQAQLNKKEPTTLQHYMTINIISSKKGIEDEESHVNKKYLLKKFDQFYRQQIP